MEKQVLYAPNFVPTQNYLLVKELPHEDRIGSIIMPDGSKIHKGRKGYVIATGDGRIGEDLYPIPETMQVGNVVTFSQYAGVELTLETPFSEKSNRIEEYLLVRVSDVVGTIPGNSVEVLNYEHAVSKGYIPLSQTVKNLLKNPNLPV